MSNRKNVPASVVREWASTEAGTAALTEAEAPMPGKRGVIAAATIAVFHRENRSKRYEPKVAEAPTVTVTVPALDSRGRRRQKAVTMTTAEARALLGQPASRKGRIPMPLLTEAVAAAEADAVADQFA